MKETAFVIIEKNTHTPKVFLSGDAVQNWFKKNKKQIDGEVLMGGGIGPLVSRIDKMGLLQYPIPVGDIAKEITRASFHSLHFGFKGKKDTGFQEVSIQRGQILK